MTVPVSIETIPTEILCNIFCLLRGSQPIILNELKNSVASFPWAVGQVCVRWRETFISYPPLWTSLSLSWYDLCSSAAYRAEINRRTAIYIKRSGQQPLTISIALVFPGAINDFPSQTMTTLVSCSNRWKDLFLCVNDRYALGFFEGCNGKMPILTSLETVGDVTASLYGIFEVVPCLTDINLSILAQDMKTLVFPWAQLTRVTMLVHWEDYDRDRNGFVQVLSQLQNVKVLRLLSTRVYSNSMVTCSDFPTVHLPRLLLFQTASAYFEVFSWIKAPSLENLCMDNLNLLTHEANRFWNRVPSLVNRSSCSIRRLTLFQGQFNAAPEVLEALTSVEELFIKVSSRTFPNIIQRIAGLGGRIYLPKLRVLEMRCFAHNIKKLVETISQFLEARLAPASCARLEKVVIRLQWCRNPGCDLENIDIPNALEAIRNCPSDAVIFIDDSELKTPGFTRVAERLV